MEIKIRDVDPVVVKKLDELAKKRHMSRNEYLKQYLSQYAVTEEVTALEDKYVGLVSVLSELLQQSQETILLNNHFLEEVLEGRFLKQR